MISTHFLPELTRIMQGVLTPGGRERYRKMFGRDVTEFIKIILKHI